MRAPELIARLFAARTAAHMAHLQTTSYAAHMALESLYESLVDVVDTFAEVYQSNFGVIQQYAPVQIPTTDPLLWIGATRDLVRDSRDECAQGMTELANLLDEILTVLGRAIYKLQNLH